MPQLVCPCSVIEPSLHLRPQVLVLHLMRFSFGERGSSKLHQPVSFGTNLKLRPSWMSEDCPDRRGAEYKLVACVTHHGRNSTGEAGHLKVWTTIAAVLIMAVLLLVECTSLHKQQQAGPHVPLMEVQQTFDRPLCA